MNEQLLNTIFKCIHQNKGGIEIKQLSAILKIQSTEVIQLALEQLLILEVIEVKHLFRSVAVCAIENDLTSTKH